MFNGLKVVVTGGAGFIGSHLVHALANNQARVTVIDNLSAGDPSSIQDLIQQGKITFHKEDLRRLEKIQPLFKHADIVFHYAANPEVRHSTRDPLDHYHQNETTTLHVLEAARKHDVPHIVYASSSTVYGDATVIPTPETHPLQPISVYGATKAAGEIHCQTYSRLYGHKCLILRYANIIGPRLRHGVIYDFIMKLQQNPNILEILGDGTQRKSYLYITDTIQATLEAVKHHQSTNDKIKIYNIGNHDWITVREIADIITREMNLKHAQYIYKKTTPDGRGWPGDVKLMLLDITRIQTETRWKPKYTSQQAVTLTTRDLLTELGLK